MVKNATKKLKISGHWTVISTHNLSYTKQESSRLDPDTQFSYIRAVVINGIFDKRSEIDKWWLCSKRPSLCYSRSN